MAVDLINLGATVNDGTGDALRIGGQKINGNFSALDTRVAALEASGTGGAGAAGGGIVTLTTPRDLAAGDAGKLILCNWATDQDLTIPSGLAVDSGWTIVQLGAGRVRPVTKSGAGQVFRALSGALYSPGQYGSISIHQYAANTWLVFGGMP